MSFISYANNPTNTNDDDDMHHASVNPPPVRLIFAHFIYELYTDTVIDYVKENYGQIARAKCRELKYRTEDEPCPNKSLEQRIRTHLSKEECQDSIYSQNFAVIEFSPRDKNSYKIHVAEILPFKHICRFDCFFHWDVAKS
jgi:hypothetical protein